MIDTLLPIGYPAITLAGLAAVSFLRTPEWVGDATLSRRDWLRVNTIGIILALALYVLSRLLHSGGSVYVTAMATALTTLGFLIPQVFASDFTKRKADRFVLRLAIVMNLPLGCLISYFRDDTSLFLYFIILAFVGMLVLIPSGIGMSDLRALFLAMVVLYPLGNVGAINMSIIAIMVIAISYSVVVSYRNGTLKTFLKDTNSVPLVPMVLTPAAVVLFMI